MKINCPKTAVTASSIPRSGPQCQKSQSFGWLQMGPRSLVPSALGLLAVWKVN